MSIQPVERVEQRPLNTLSGRLDTAKPWIGGLIFTFFCAILGYGLAQLPGFSRLGPLAAAIVIAIAYRHFAGYPESIRAGVQFTARYVLRAAIILYGLRLNLEVVFQEGLPLLVRGAVTILFSIVVMLGLARLFKADTALSLLVGVGTGVCGAAAIAAVAPILNTKDEETALSVGMIALTGTVFAIGYTVILPYLPLDALQYGVWSGLSLHELAHVALAAAPAGQDALAIALLAKLGRVFLLVPLCFILLYWMKRKNADSSEAGVPFPWFLIGFILMSVAGTYLLGPVIPVPPVLLTGLSEAATFMLTMAMVALGLTIHFEQMKSKALRPLLALFVTSLLLSVLTFWII